MKPGRAGAPPPPILRGQTGWNQVPMTTGPSKPLNTGKAPGTWVLRPQSTFCGQEPAGAGTIIGLSRQSQRETRPWNHPHPQLRHLTKGFGQMDQPSKYLPRSTRPAPKGLPAPLPRTPGSCPWILPGPVRVRTSAIQIPQPPMRTGRFWNRWGCHRPPAAQGRMGPFKVRDGEPGSPSHSRAGGLRSLSKMKSRGSHSGKTPGERWYLPFPIQSSVHADPPPTPPKDNRPLVGPRSRKGLAPEKIFYPVQKNRAIPKGFWGQPSCFLPHGQNLNRGSRGPAAQGVVQGRRVGNGAFLPLAVLVPNRRD